MNKKRIFLFGLLVLLIIFGIYKGFIQKKKPSFSLFKVARMNISEEVSASGVVTRGDEINLAFKTSGRIEKINIKVGDKVETGQDLAEIDNKEALLQLKEAEANLQIIQAQRADAELTLRNAQQDLADATTKAEENLSNAYQDAINALDDAYLKIYNAYTAANLIKRTYFESADQESITIEDNKYKIENALYQLKFYIDNAKKTLENEDIDSALSKAGEILSITRDALGVIRNTVETSAKKDIISSTDKASIDTQKLNINTSYDNIVSSQQNISTTKINNATNINNAQSTITELANQLQYSREGLYQAQITQAESKVALLQNQIQDTLLISPTSGQITDIEKKEGEIIQEGQLVISFLPTNPFQVKVDIYEEDVVKMSIGNSVDISLTAFPDKVFKGKIISINPDQTLKEGVVYYETTIDFENPPEKIKPGMTTDLTITTMTKDNVLVIPNAAIEMLNDKATVQILNGKNVETHQIEIGIKDNNNMVEVISGLKEGEEVIIKS